MENCIPRKKRLPVLRPGGGLAYLASPADVRELGRAGLAKVYGKGRRLDGCVLFEGPSQAHAGTRYVHAHEVSETWTDPEGVLHFRPHLEPNVRGVYAFKSITGLEPAMFRQVQIDCLRKAA
jgi:hypothetical protein